MQRPAPIRYGLATLAVLAGSLLGCSATAPLGGAREDGTDREAGLFAPAIKGANDGLEVQWWVVRGGLHQLADFPVSTPGGTDPETAALWSAHGLRLLTIPFDRLPDLEALLGAQEGAAATGLGIQRQWLGQCTEWTPLVEGPHLRPTGIWMDTGPLALPAGRLRLLGRAWTEPAMHSSEACRSLLRVELAPQHAERKEQDPLGLQPPAAPELMQEGLIFRRLATTLRLNPDQVLIIIPERPDVTWGEPAADDAAPAQPTATAEPNVATLGRVVRDARPPSTAAGSGAGGDSADAAAGEGEEGGGGPQIGAAGPRAPRLPTLGEAMLVSTRPDATNEPGGRAAGSRGTVRAIVVLIPRLPEDFRLLPR